MGLSVKFCLFAYYSPIFFENCFQLGNENCENFRLGAPSLQWSLAPLSFSRGGKKSQKEGDFYLIASAFTPSLRGFGWALPLIVH